MLLFFFRQTCSHRLPANLMLLFSHLKKVTDLFLMAGRMLFFDCVQLWGVACWSSTPWSDWWKVKCLISPITFTSNLVGLIEFHCWLCLMMKPCVYFDFYFCIWTVTAIFSVFCFRNFFSLQIWWNTVDRTVMCCQGRQEQKKIKNKINVCISV